MDVTTEACQALLHHDTLEQPFGLGQQGVTAASHPGHQRTLSSSLTLHPSAYPVTQVQSENHDKPGSCPVSLPFTVSEASFVFCKVEETFCLETKI